MQIGSSYIAFAISGPAQQAKSHDHDEKKAETREPGNAEKPATKVTLSQEAKSSLQELSDSEKNEVAQLKARDAEVRAHEAAHVGAAGGNTSGGIQYEFERGPDNRQYAVGGHVSIDTAPIAGDPAKTIQKAETVRRAALAPADPSSADKQVAAKASQTAAKARIELATEKQEAHAEVQEETDAGQGDSSRPRAPMSQAVASYQAIA